MIGVFGGTFDPVHFGHLRPALELHEALGLETVHLIPAGVPPHRRQPFVATEHRLAMLATAIDGQPGFRLDEREVRREGPSYMVETLGELRREYGGNTPLCLLLGMDAFLGLASWHDWRGIPELAHIVVSHRPGWAPDALEDQGGPMAELVARNRVADTAALRERPAGRVYLHPVTQLDISSTRIRALVREGLSPRYLLPAGVHDYIQREGLYR